MDIPASIVCVDCGGHCVLISSRPDDDPFEAGDIVAYRCNDCADRWDLVLEPEDFATSDDETY